VHRRDLLFNLAVVLPHDSRGFLLAHLEEHLPRRPPGSLLGGGSVDVGHADMRQAATQHHSSKSARPQQLRAHASPRSLNCKFLASSPVSSFTPGSGEILRQSRARSCPLVYPCRCLASASLSAPCGCSAGQTSTAFTIESDEAAGKYWLGERAGFAGI